MSRNLLLLLLGFEIAFFFFLVLGFRTAHQANPYQAEISFFFSVSKSPSSSWFSDSGQHQTQTHIKPKSHLSLLDFQNLLVCVDSSALTLKTTCSRALARVSSLFCSGAREFVRISRHSDHDDLLNSAIGGFGSGALLGRLQGGQKGAIRYSIAFAVAGTAVDFATLKLRPLLKGLSESSNKNGGGLRLPEWSPIQILNEEELAAKQAREQKMYARSTLSTLDKKES